MPGGLYPPPRVIASWPLPNFKDPPTQGNGVVILCAVLGACSVFVVGTRLIARAFVQRNFGIDDWVMVAAMVPTIGLAVGMSLATNVYGFNIHIWDLRISGYIPARKIYFANDILYILSSGLIKVSILLFYKRMSSGTFSRRFVYVVWGCIAFVIAYMIAFILIVVVGCTPTSAFWWEVDPLISRPHHCINEPRSVLAATSISLIQDFIAASLPMALFASLKIPKRQRLALGAVFALGYFLCVANGLRMYYIYKTFYETYDVTWTAYYIWLWTAVEILLAPICASAPALKVYFRGILQDHSWSTWGSSLRSGSRRFRPARRIDDEYATNHTDTMYSRDDTNRLSLPLKDMDSPTLGAIKTDDVERLGNVRESAISEKQLHLMEKDTPRGSATKAEKTLGLR